MYHSTDPSEGGLGEWMGVLRCKEDPVFAATYPAACPGYQEAADVAQAAADIAVAAEGTLPPSELEAAYTEELGEDQPPAVIADGGLVTAIEEGAAGDLAARIGLPRGVASFAIGVAIVLGLAQAVRYSAER